MTVCPSNNKYHFDNDTPKHTDKCHNINRFPLLSDTHSRRKVAFFQITSISDGYTFFFKKVFE